MVPATRPVVVPPVMGKMFRVPRLLAPTATLPPMLTDDV